MRFPLAALPLLLITTTTPLRAAAQGAPGEGKVADEPGAESPPLPPKPPDGSRAGGMAPTGAGVEPGDGTTPPPAGQPGAAGAPAPSGQHPVGTLPPPKLTEVKPAVVSLLSGDPLRGGSAALAWAGWASFGALYAQGITDQDDLGAQLDFDWTKTELRLGGFYRRPLGPAGAFHMAGRLGVSWFLSMGSELFYGGNHNDHGFEIAPGLSLSTPAGKGIFSILGDAPITVTLKGGGGVLFIPRASVAYEVPFYGPYTLGLRTGIGWRGGSGDAPLREGRAEFQLLVLGGWRLF
jgi:hypothetical protein